MGLALRHTFPASPVSDDLRQKLIGARKQRGWSQAELSRWVGLPQTHISAIETGKTTPPYDTLLELLRVLGLDLLPIPRELVPAVQALIGEHRHLSGTGDSERPLYAFSG